MEKDNVSPNLSAEIFTVLLSLSVDMSKLLGGKGKFTHKRNYQICSARIRLISFFSL